MVSTQMDPDDDPPISNGRFAPLSSDSDSDNPHVCRAPADAVDSGRIAVRIVPSEPKRLRLASRSLRMSQVSTLPAADFDLTQADSDLETARVEAERPQERGNTFRFEPWVGGTPNSPDHQVCLWRKFRSTCTGDTETDSVGSVNIPNRFVQNEGEDTDDTATVVEDQAEIAVPRAPALRHATKLKWNAFSL